MEEHIRLREEHINVEHTTMNKPFSSDDSNRLQNQDPEMQQGTRAGMGKKIRLGNDMDDTDLNNRDRNHTIGRDTRLDTDDNSRGI